jgi:hypothetical protein
MCGEFGLSQDSGEHAELLAPYCRRYGCDDCLPIIRRRLQRQIRAGRPNKLLTLTMRRVEGGDPIAAAGVLMKSWDTFLKRLRRHLGDDEVQFLHVKEGTRKGWPHLHVALRMKSVDHTLIRGWWEEITGAFQVDIRAVKSVRGVAKYLAKYLTKDLVKFGSYRVWSSSRRWAVDPVEKQEPVSSVGQSRPVRLEGGMTSHRNMLERAGYFITWTSLRSWNAYGPHDWPEWAYRERLRKEANTRGYVENLR